jgi:hypothetical protein
LAEIKRVWVVRDAAVSDLDDPAIQNEAHLLEQFMWEMDIDKFVRVVSGTPGDKWREEHSKVYDDEASARKDAVKRLGKLRKLHGKSAAERVAARYNSI